MLSSVRSFLAGVAMLALTFGAGWWCGARAARAVAEQARAIADSVANAATDSLRAELAGAQAHADTMQAAWRRDSATLRELAHRPLRVDTLWRRDTAGDASAPAVPIPVVAKADYDSLHRACDGALSSCAVARAAEHAARLKAEAVARQLASRPPIIIHDRSSRLGLAICAGPSIAADLHARWAVSGGLAWRLWP